MNCAQCHQNQVKPGQKLCSYCFGIKCSQLDYCTGCGKNRPNPGKNLCQDCFTKQRQMQYQSRNQNQFLQQQMQPNYEQNQQPYYNQQQAQPYYNQQSYYNQQQQQQVQPVFQMNYGHQEVQLNNCQNQMVQPQTYFGQFNNQTSGTQLQQTQQQYVQQQQYSQSQYAQQINKVCVNCNINTANKNHTFCQVCYVNHVYSQTGVGVICSQCSHNIANPGQNLCQICFNKTLLCKKCGINLATCGHSFCQQCFVDNKAKKQLCVKCNAKPHTPGHKYCQQCFLAMKALRDEQTKTTNNVSFEAKSTGDKIFSNNQMCVNCEIHNVLPGLKYCRICNIDEKTFDSQKCGVNGCPGYKRVNNDGSLGEHCDLHITYNNVRKSFQ